MEFDTGTLSAMRANLEEVSRMLYRHLNQEYGSYKKAPDDHPFFKALTLISAVMTELPEDDEDDAGV